jgi:hypothetical protein
MDVFLHVNHLIRISGTVPAEKPKTPVAFLHFPSSSKFTDEKSPATCLKDPPITHFRVPVNSFRPNGPKRSLYAVLCEQGSATGKNNHRQTRRGC